MAKKRTGLQSDIAGIFSGVPIPKKGGTRSQSDSPKKKPDEAASKPDGTVSPKPVAPQPRIPVVPTPQEPQKPIEPTPKPKVVEIKTPELKPVKIPKKIRRQRKVKSPKTKSNVSDSRQKTAIAMFVFFTTALVIVLARPYLKPRRIAPRPGANGQVNNAVASTANIDIKWPVPPVYSSKLRDPMSLDSKEQFVPESPYDIVIKGITYTEERRIVVIGTETLQEGDVVLGATIVKINPGSVVFERDGERFTKYVKRESE